MEEIADARVVAVAIDGFVFEMVFVVPQFFVDVGKLGVELVILARLAAWRDLLPTYQAPPKTAEVLDKLLIFRFIIGWLAGCNVSKIHKVSSCYFSDLTKGRLKPFQTAFRWIETA